MFLSFLFFIFFLSCILNYFSTIKGYAKTLVFDERTVAVTFYNGKTEKFNIITSDKNIFGEYKFGLDDGKQLAGLKLGDSDWSPKLSEAIANTFVLGKFENKNNADVYIDIFDVGANTSFWEIALSILFAILFATFDKKVNRLIT